MAMSGGCMCGAVRFEATRMEMAAHACHCGMCRKWSDSGAIAVPVAANAMTFDDADNMRKFKSSDRAERGWCNKCGSKIFNRITIAGAKNSNLYVGMGLFDYPEALLLKPEIYIDRKPSILSFAGDLPCITQAETEATFAPPPDAA